MSWPSASGARPKPSRRIRRLCHRACGRASASPRSSPSSPSSPPSSRGGDDGLGVSTSQIIFGLAVFLLAGTVKGLVGLGLSTVTIALTSLVLPPPEAIALISLPTIVTNVWQAAVGGKFWIIVRRQWPLIVPLAIVLYLTVWLVRS